MDRLDDIQIAWENLGLAMEEFGKALVDIMGPILDEIARAMRALYVWMKRTNATMWLANHGINHPAVDWLIAKLPGWMLPEPRYLLRVLDT